MLETVREYAEECLVESAEAEATRDRHARFYRDLVEQAAPELRGRDQALWLDRLEYEHTNIRAALDWLVERNNLDDALRLATAATWYWLRRSYFTDARRLISLLSTTQDHRTAARAAALYAAARLASTQGDYRAQAAYNQESLQLFQTLRDPAGVAEAVTDLGVATWQQGDLDEAQTYLAEGLARFRDLQDSVGIATALLPLACVARDRGDFESARPLFAEALARRRSAADQLGTAHVLNNLAWLDLYAGSLESARKLCEGSLAIRQAAGARRETGVSQTLLGKVALAAGQAERAARLLLDSLELHQQVGNRWGMALALEGVACLASTDQPEQAIRLAGTAAAVRAAIGRPLAIVELPMIDSYLNAARAALASDAVQRLWAEGEALGEAQAVAAAMAVAEGVLSPESKVG
jgi:tetratricopeptide (TPR) repeat protein